VTTTPGASITTTGTSVTVTGLTNGAAYTVSVVASNAKGAGPASSGSGTPKGPWKVGKLGGPSTAKAGSKVTLTVVVTGGKVTTKVVLQRKVGKAWKVVGTFKYDKKHKRWTISVTAPTKKGGVLNLRALAKGDAAHTDSPGPARTVKAV